MKKRVIPIAGIFLIATSVYAQTEVLTGVMHGKDYGVTYMLPKTTIEFTIQATKHSYTPGDYCQYAERYMRIEDVSAEPQVYWTLDNVEIKTKGVPDPAHVYFVKLKDKTTAPLMELTQEGIIRSINLPYSGIQPDTPQPPSQPAEQKTNPKKFLTEEILMASSTAKMAELTAKEIYNIRESKNALLRGEAEFMPTDGAQLKIMLDNLTLQENALTEMFVGKEEAELQTFTIQLEPEEMTDKVAFRFSKYLGVVGSDNLAGEPIYINLRDLNMLPAPTAEDEKNRKTEGVAYNVPGKARITVSYQQKTLFDEELPFTQFGCIEYLAPILFNKNKVTKVLFDTTTGSLLKIDRGEP